MVDVAHHGHDRRARQHCERRVGLPLQVVLDDVFLAQHRRVAHLLDHQHRGVLLDHLIDRRHHAHVHHDLDDFGGLDRHLLREFADGHRFADRHLAHHARGRHFEAMLGVRIAADRAAASVAGFLLLVPCADVAGDVQFLASVAGCLVVHHGPCGLARLGGGGLAFALRHFACLYLGDAARFLFRRALAVLFVAAPPALLLEPLAVQPLLLETLALRAFERGLGLLLRFALLVDLFLLVAGLVLEDLALDVGALAANLDVDGARASLRARELQFRLRFAPQRDLPRGRIRL